MDFRPYDAHDLKTEPSYFQISKKIGIELNESDFASIKDTITDAIGNIKMHESRLEAKNIMWQYQGEAKRRIVDFMEETVNKGKD